jgi:hypothetical protein
MNTELLVILVAYAVLGFLLLFLCLWTRWPLLIKGLMVFLVTGFYLQSFDALRSQLGWPTEDQLPPRFVVLAVVFDEPRKEDHFEGHIYLWAHGLQDGHVQPQPRSYKLAYAKDLHALLAEAMKKNREGNSQMGTTEPSYGPKGFNWLRPAGNDVLKIRITDLPRPQLPEK